MPLELIEERIHDIENEKAPVLKQLDDIENKLENQDWQKIDIEVVFGNLLRFNQVFDEMEFEEKRIFLRSMVKEIVYTEGSIKMALYFLPEITSKTLSNANDNHGTSVSHGCPFIPEAQECSFSTTINIEETLPEGYSGTTIKERQDAWKGLQVLAGQERLEPHTISNWENDKYKPAHPSKLKRVADVLRCINGVPAGSAAG